MSLLLASNVQNVVQKQQSSTDVLIVEILSMNHIVKNVNEKASTHSHKEFPLKTSLLAAQEKMGLRVKEPFKGVKELINQDKNCRTPRKRTRTTKPWAYSLQRRDCKI